MIVSGLARAWSGFAPVQIRSARLRVWGEPVAPPPRTGFSPPAIVPPGIYARPFDQVARIKLNAAYTEAMGKDLGIVDPDDAQKAASQFPKVTATVLDATQNQIFDLKVNGGARTARLVDSPSPYIDNRPLLVPGQPETREFRVRYWDNGTPNGNFTPAVKVTVGQ